MSASRNVCKEQVMLFRNYHGFPSEQDDNGKPTEAARREIKTLIDTFERWCANDDHAAAVGQKLLDISKFCPKPVDIHDAAEEIRARYVTHQIGVTCGGVCEGSGYVRVEKDGKKFVKYCICHPGGKKAEPKPTPAKQPVGMRSAAQITGERE